MAAADHSDSPFERAIRSRPQGGGRYAIEITDTYDGPVSPNGGVLAAALLRAAQAELGPGAPPPRTVAASYLAPPRSGPAEIAVEVLRRGRRVAMTEARLHQDGQIAVTASFVHSASRQAAELTHLARPVAPDVPPPEQVPAFAAGSLPGAPPVFGVLTIRPVFGPPVLGGAAEAVTGGWLAIEGDDAPLDPARLVAMSDLWWPAIFTAVDRPAPIPTVQLTVHLRRVEPPDGAPRPPLLARFTTREVAEGHADEVGELWSREGELLAESRQLALWLPIG